MSLARAVYDDENELFLLDDPLSAVDAKVAQHLFKEVILGLLKEKAVVLVTHQVQFLSQCDQILVLEKGRLSLKGTYSDQIALAAKQV